MTRSRFPHVPHVPHVLRASRARRAAACALACAPLALAWPHARQLVESRMALHMLLEFPALLASGWACAAWLRRHVPRFRACDRIDAGGAFGATVVTALAAFWMLPVALDLSLLSDAAWAAKVAGWWIAGALLCRSGPRLGDVPVAFLAGNLAWMLATAGLLYQDAGQRLCVNYLLDDQVTAGRALVLTAAAVGALAALRLARPRAAREDAWPRG